MLSAFERFMNSITFAEAGDHETAIAMLEDVGKEMKTSDKAATQRVGLAETAEQYMRAITFAEEGEHQYARETLEETPTPAIAAKSKCILVLGNEDTFADYLINYAIDMAERFGYEIIALNALPMSRKTRLLTGFADEIGDRFQNNSARAGESFRKIAEEHGVPFRQEIQLMSEQKAMRRLHKEHGNIEFVLTEPENLTEEQAPECSGSVCVCSLV
jgi:hypothetical protein